MPAPTFFYIDQNLKENNTISVVLKWIFSDPNWIIAILTLFTLLAVIRYSRKSYKTSFYVLLLNLLQTQQEKKQDEIKIFLDALTDLLKDDFPKDVKKLENAIINRPNKK